MSAVEPCAVCVGEPRGLLFHGSFTEYVGCDCQCMRVLDTEGEITYAAWNARQREIKLGRACIGAGVAIVLEHIDGYWWARVIHPGNRHNLTHGDTREDALRDLGMVLDQSYEIAPD